MSTGMLGESEVLRRIWCGPLLDLAVKLNSKDGPDWERAFMRFLRKEDPWEDSRLTHQDGLIRDKLALPVIARTALDRLNIRTVQQLILLSASELNDAGLWMGQIDEIREQLRKVGLCLRKESL